MSSIILGSSVFSTYVEVILDQTPDGWRLEGILHVCGGDPLDAPNVPKMPVYSPRMWR